MKVLSALSALALSLTMSAALAASTPSPTKTPHAAKPLTANGFWQQADDQGKVGGWFYFEQVKDHYEGRIVKMFSKPGEKVYETCTACPGDQKNAAMLGLTLVKGMHRDGLKYTDGTIMDPRNGSVYSAQMELSPDGQKLSVRGFLGLPMLGETQVWTRLPDDSMAPEDIPPDSALPSASASPAAN